MADWSWRSKCATCGSRVRADLVVVRVSVPRTSGPYYDLPAQVACSRCLKIFPPERGGALVSIEAIETVGEGAA